MTRPTAPQVNTSMAMLYLAMIEEVTAVADHHRRLAAERLGAGAALRLRVLVLLTEGEMDGRAPKELAARMAMPKQTLARALRELQADGLVEVGDYRGDGRCKSIWITDIGGLAIEEMLEALDRDLRLLADIARLHTLSDALWQARQIRKLQATCAAYRKRGVRKRPTLV